MHYTKIDNPTDKWMYDAFRIWNAPPSYQMWQPSFSWNLFLKKKRWKTYPSFLPILPFLVKKLSYPLNHKRNKDDEIKKKKQRNMGSFGLFSHNTRQRDTIHAVWRTYTPLVRDHMRWQAEWSVCTLGKPLLKFVCYPETKLFLMAGY